MYICMPAGKLPEARRVCAQAGEAWRSAALGGVGEWGPLPVGVAASDMDEGLTEDAQVGGRAWPAK